MSDELATTNGHAGKLATMTEPPHIGSILQAAVERGMDVDKLDKLFELYEREMNRKARQEFFAAMAKFQLICPPIPRRTENNQFTAMKNGTKVVRKYAALEDIEATIKKPLAECGLSYGWSKTVIDKGVLTKTFVVSHIGGHSEEASASMPVESKAGCSEQQKYGSASTYARRESIKDRLGLTSCDEDADGNDGGNGEAPTITDQQAMRIEGKLADTSSNPDGFRKHFGIDRIADLPVHRFAEAMNMLDAKAKKMAAAKGNA